MMQVQQRIDSYLALMLTTHWCAYDIEGQLYLLDNLLLSNLRSSR
jgi:hypothetical protein